ncbi:hypothetical protein FHW67_000091 [Herbaspirillum sp. Sphag1AN]|uniref:alginate lyase family protein n=1 Tax=unclassified Herbaspirillum TaxID=2624150 RepID=UPI0016135807|nr:MULTISPECIES: alginate lyase family protein [unclassified Herbaspirillum]MBB3210856.1 hypothetical protein [Herbaspirillum sp. Sphag1AN]MBB3244486.1 hypothetical protein [Herbaspirillum sp. Sphag64]
MKSIAIHTVMTLLSLSYSATSSAGISWCESGASNNLSALRNEVRQKLLPESRAIERVHTEGTLPHQGIWDQSVEAEKDWPVMRDLALLWRQQHQSEDLNTLSRLLSDWGTRYQPSFNPIDETNLDAYIDAYAISRDDLSPTVRKTAEQFIRALGEGYLTRMERDFRLSDGRWINNWNSHRVKLATLAAAALSDDSMWRRARTQYQAHLNRNLYADGTTVDFEERDALHYVVYDLEPLARAALAARLRNEDWLDMKNGQRASLEDALDWLAPYASGEKIHEEFVHSRVRFDYQRRDAGLPGYAGIWDKQLASNLYAMAARLNPKYLQLSSQLQPLRGWMAACWSK